MKVEAMQTLCDCLFANTIFLNVVDKYEYNISMINYPKNSTFVRSNNLAFGSVILFTNVTCHLPVDIILYHTANKRFFFIFTAKYYSIIIRFSLRIVITSDACDFCD